MLWIVEATVVYSLSQVINTATSGVFPGKSHHSKLPHHVCRSDSEANNLISVALHIQSFSSSHSNSYPGLGKQTTGRMQQAFLLRNFKKLKFELNRQGAVPHSRNSEGSVFAVFTENDELCYGGCATEQRLNKPSRSQMEVHRRLA